MALSGLSPKYTRDVQSNTVSVTSGPYSLRNLCLKAVTIGSLFLPRSSTARYRPRTSNSGSPRCCLTGGCIMKSWHLRMLKLFPALYATMASASWARSVPLVLNVRITSSRPKRSKNAWAQTRLPIGTDKLSLRLIWNVLKCVCLVTNHHSRTPLHYFVPICHHDQMLLILSKSGYNLKIGYDNR